MLLHGADSGHPARVVVIGARGFIGQALVRRLRAAEIDCLPLNSSDLDLAGPAASEALEALLRPEDSVVMLSALTPDKGKGIETLMRNLAMGQAVCAALARRPCRHVVYVSSDAVYDLTESHMNEATPTAPGDLYGSMHRLREVMMKTAAPDSLAVLRPTLVYGFGDSHNSYGPNRFRRQSMAEGRIVLGGKGEETRDYIGVDDVARLIELTLCHRATGTLNLATGRSISALDVAVMVGKALSKPVAIVYTERTVPITYRCFDVTAVHKAFPQFRFTPLEAGLERAQEQEGRA